MTEAEFDEMEQYSGKLVKTLRVEIQDQPGAFAALASAIGVEGALLGDIVRVRITSHVVIRDVTVYVEDDSHLNRIIEAVRGLSQVTLMDVRDEVQAIHRGGKIMVTSRVPLRTVADLRMIYTPGVAQVCQAIQNDPGLAYELTSIGNSVAVVTNGTAVLGLGDIGIRAGMPVMEGKAVILVEMGQVSAFPILVETHEPKALIETVERIAHTFGAILLEDIAAPACFEVEQTLIDRLDMPVFHDDQHGTAVVALAALRNALRQVGKTMESVRVVINGAGAAGVAIARMLLEHGTGDVILCDRAGAIWQGRTEHMNRWKEELAGNTNRDRCHGNLAEALTGSDVFIGVSGPNLVSRQMVSSMASGAVVLALANPVPEIRPQDALAAGAAVVADGRSINNALGFPGIFRGTLDARARRINRQMLAAASTALADMGAPEHLVPDFMDRSVHRRVAEAVKSAAVESGAAL